MRDDVQLRSVRESDLPIFFEQQLDPEATRMAAFPARGRDTFFDHWKTIMAEESTWLRTIVYQGKVAGNIGCWEQFDEWKVGYWLGRGYWGKGIASAALAQFLGEVPDRPLIARVAKHNVASLRVLRKCGFTIIGEDTFPGIDGALCDEYVLSLSPTDPS